MASYITDAAKKEFNGVSLFSANAASVTIDSDGSKWSMSAINLGASEYTTATAGNVSTTAGAVTALTNIKTAITKLASDRATAGASIARMNYTSEQLKVQKTNLESASSRIKDVDVAEESTQYAKYSILVQSGTAMLAQANAQPQSMLQLLG